MADEIERIITIPLRATKMAPRTKRAERAIKEIRDNIARHMKAEKEDVWIDKSLNEKIWERGIQNPPHKITVKAVKFDDGLVEVSLVGPAGSEAKPAAIAEAETAKEAEPKALEDRPKAKQLPEPKSETEEKPEAEEEVEGEEEKPETKE